MSLLSALLQELRGLRESWDSPWCLGGDFNEVMEPRVILVVEEVSLKICSPSLRQFFLWGSPDIWNQVYVVKYVGGPLF